MPDASPAAPASKPIWPPVSSGVRPSLIRYLIHSDSIRGTILLTGFAFIAAVILLYLGQFLWGHGRLKVAMLGLVLMTGGAIAALVAVFVGVMSVVLIPRDLRHVRDHPLAPGILVSTRPNHVMMLAETGRAIPGAAYVLSRLIARTLGPMPAEVGGRIPCFTRRLEEYEADTVHMIHADVVACATGDAIALEQCNEKIGGERYRLAAEAVRCGPLPGTTLEYVFFDRNLDYVGCWRTRFNQAIEGDEAISNEYGFIPAERFRPDGA